METHFKKIYQNIENYIQHQAALFWRTETVAGQSQRT
jgi:hypothetical protein